jgi:hypothetical protein
LEPVRVRQVQVIQPVNACEQAFADHLHTIYFASRNHQWRIKIEAYATGVGKAETVQAQISRKFPGGEVRASHQF